MLHFKFRYRCDCYKCNLEYSNEQNANKNLQGIEEYIMKEILIFLIFALAVFAAILINEGGK